MHDSTVISRFTRGAIRWTLTAAFTTALAAAVLLASAAPGRAQGLTLGFYAFSPFPDQTQWIDRAVSEGAGIARINVLWARVAPSARPRGFQAVNPASPGYHWAGVDAQVKELSSRGMRILVTVYDAPLWAEGAHMPHAAKPGTWRPDARQYAEFVTAAARRYAGNFPDPADPGRMLPRVRLWQAWNEPNLDYYLAPQWVRGRHGWVSTAPVLFRGLLNAFYSAVKRVAPSNVVLAAGTAPYGDQPGSSRMPPVEFYRDLFCLQGAHALRPVGGCGDAPHFDILDHHPYGTGSPTQPAFNPDDVAVPDIYKITRVLRAAERAGHVVPRAAKPVWVTEIAWDSSPPDPKGVPVDEQARWVEQSFYVLWRQGVSTIMLLQIVDSPPVPSYAESYQSGLYFLNGQRKPAATAYAFPLVAARSVPGTILVWGRSPSSGILSIEVRQGRRWLVMARLHVSARQVFQRRLKASGRLIVRASVGRSTSLPWTQAV